MKNRLKSYFKYTISPITLVSVLVLACVVAFFVFTNDEGGIAALKWLGVITMLVVVTRPILPIEKLELWDGGYGISAGLGIAISFLAVWFPAAFGIIPFNTVTIFIALFFVCIVVAVTLYVMNKNGIKTYKWQQDSIERLLWGLALFSLAYLFAFWVVGFNGTLSYGTEKYMDYGFMQAIYRQERVVPCDIWFSGEKLNYYYLGQAAAVMLCRMAFTTPEYGYNLMLITCWSITLVASGEIAMGYVKTVCKDNQVAIKREKIACVGAAVISTLINAFAANGQWLIYGIVKPFFLRITGQADRIVNYWFPEATVFISTELGDPDNGKNEFPAYSVILGDLHAHVVNVIFVLPLIAVLLDYIFINDDKKNYKKIVLAGILLGMYKGSNYWDFAIYFVITGGVVVLCDMYRNGFNRKTLFGIWVKALIVIVLSMVIIIPFNMSFNKMSSHIMLSELHSPLWKLLVLWGFPFIVTGFLLIWIYFGNGRKIIFRAASKIGLLAITLCSMGLVISPEIIFILDIYGLENARFNTMFKFTYQAYILFGILVGIAAGVIAIRMYSGMVVILTVSILMSTYMFHAINDWMGNIFEPEYRKGISAIESLRQVEGFDFELAAMDIINEDKRKLINIVEAAGNSYQHESTLSVLTGTCTTVGWFVHEWMWRNDSNAVAIRSDEVRMFYECADENYCRKFIEKYDIDYIFTGEMEWNKYNVDISGYKLLGETVMEYNNSGHQIMLIKCN